MVVSDCIEMMFVKIVPGGQKYLIGSIYRSPYFPLMSFIEKFGSVLQTITTDHKNVSVINCGDMNINLLGEGCTA